MECKGIFDLHDCSFNLYFQRFRWVFCQLEVLRCCFPTNLRRTLKELPKSLDETYMRVLKDINNANWEHARRLLQCLTVAHRPLLVEELAEVLAFDFTAGGTPKSISNWRLEDREEAVLSACSSLVSVISDEDSRVVQFSHFSVKEFLTSERLTSRIEEESRFYIPIEPSHTMLARACLGVLLCLDDHTDIYSAEKMPLFRYATNYWHRHAQIGNVELEIAGAMDYFFDTDKPYFAAWVRLQDRAKLGIPRTIVRSSDMPDSVFPVCVAAGNGFRGLVERLITKHPQHINHSDGSFGTPMHALIAGGAHIKVAQLLFEHGANINSLASHDVTPLHLASHMGNFEIGKWLLNHGADVNAQMKDGRTPLYLAVECGHLEAARLLLEHHAEVNSQEINGSTPLLSASRIGRANVALLLKYGANVHVSDKYGMTSLHLAARHCHLEVVRKLLELNVEVNSRDKNGSTPLHHALKLAFEGGNDNIAWLLLDHGSDAHVCNNLGKTPLHLAAENGYLELTRKLLQLNVEVNSRDKNGATPLLFASGNGHMGVSQLLLDHNADVHVRDCHGNTPLHRAASNCRLEVARILLKHNAEVDARDSSGSTPLHAVAAGLRGRRQGKKDFVQLLLDHGADAQACNLSGQTPSDHASMTWSRVQILLGVLGDASDFDPEEIVQLLSQYAAK